VPRSGSGALVRAFGGSEWVPDISGDGGSEDRGALRRANDSASASKKYLAGVRWGISRSLFSDTAAQDTDGEERPGSPLIVALLTPEALLRVGPSPAGQGSRPQAASPVPRLREEGAGGGFDEAARAGC
jgi:hypothetical protein